MHFAARIVIDDCTAQQYEFPLFSVGITIDPFGRRTSKEGHIYNFTIV